MLDVASCNIWRLEEQGIFMLKNILVVPSTFSYVIGSYLPFPPSGTQTKYENLEVRNNAE